MENNISNNIKACVFIGDILQPLAKITKESVLTLQDFFYKTERRKNEDSIPYGPPLGTVLRFTVRTLPDGCLKKIYEALKCKEQQTFSFVMDAVFEEGQDISMALDDYRSAFIVSGYVINIEESYNADECIFAPQKQGCTKEQNDLMTTHVSLLIETITYIGDNNRNIPFYIK